LCTNQIWGRFVLSGGGILSWGRFDLQTSFSNNRIQERSFWNTPDGNHIFWNLFRFRNERNSQNITEHPSKQQFPKEQNSGLWTKLSNAIY